MNALRYVKWHVVALSVEDVSHTRWPLTCDDHYIYYREPHPSETMWHAISCRTGIIRLVNAQDVPTEVKLALVLSQ